jgi:hypothetical protein
MAKSPLFSAKPNSELLQSRSDWWSRRAVAFGTSVEEPLPAWLDCDITKLRPKGVLQIHRRRTERACTPNGAATAPLEARIEFPGTFAHVAQCYLKGRFVQWPNYIVATCYSCTSTATQYVVDSRFSGVVSYQFSVVSVQPRVAHTSPFMYAPQPALGHDINGAYRKSNVCATPVLRSLESRIEH